MKHLLQQGCSSYISQTTAPAKDHEFQYLRLCLGEGCSHSNRYIISLSGLCIPNISLSPSLPEKIDPALYKELKIICPEGNARQDYTDVPWCQLIIFCRPLRRLRKFLEVRSLRSMILLKNLLNFLVHESRGPGNMFGNRS